MRYDIFDASEPHEEVSPPVELDASPTTAVEILISHAMILAYYDTPRNKLGRVLAPQIMRLLTMQPGQVLINFSLEFLAKA